MTEAVPEVSGPVVDRRSGRVILVDGRRRVLLLRGHDPRRPEGGSWWFTPGGGAEPGETFAEAARRELAEETGHLTDRLDGPVHHRTASFEFDGTRYRQVEQFFLARVGALAVDTGGWSALERRSVTGWRWMSAAELGGVAEPVYPEGLFDLLRRLGLA